MHADFRSTNWMYSTGLLHNVKHTIPLTQVSNISFTAHTGSHLWETVNKKIPALREITSVDRKASTTTKKKKLTNFIPFPRMLKQFIFFLQKKKFTVNRLFSGSTLHIKPVLV